MSNSASHDSPKEMANAQGRSEESSRSPEFSHHTFFIRFIPTLGASSLTGFFLSVVGDIHAGGISILNSPLLPWSIGLFFFIAVTWGTWLARAEKYISNMNVWRIPLLLPPIAFSNIYLAIPALGYNALSSQPFPWSDSLLLASLCGFFVTSVLVSVWALHERDTFEYSTRTFPPPSQLNRQWRAIGTTSAVVSLLTTFLIIALTHTPIHSWSTSDLDTSGSIDNATIPLTPMSGTLVWSTTLPESAEPHRILPGAHGPIVSNSDNNSVLGLSIKDGSIIWEWKIRDHTKAYIDVDSARISPDGRYYAALIDEKVSTDINNPLGWEEWRNRLIILDATTGKELWSRPIREEDRQNDDSDSLNITLTNRVLSIGRKVMDITTGKPLWDLPEDAWVVNDIHSKETLLVSMEGNYQRGWQDYGNNPQSASCSECNMGVFQVVEDTTGKRVGNEFTGLFQPKYDDAIAAHGWIIVHNLETHMTTLRNIDSGQEIPGPKGIIESSSQARRYAPNESISLDIAPVEQLNSGKRKAENRVVFTPQDKALSTLPYTDEIPYGDLLLPAEQGKEQLVHFMDSRYTPTLELLTYDDEIFVGEYTLHDLGTYGQVGAWPVPPRGIRSHGGWLILAGGNDEDYSNRNLSPSASQLLFIK